MHCSFGSQPRHKIVFEFFDMKDWDVVCIFLKHRMHLDVIKVFLIYKI